MTGVTASSTAAVPAESSIKRTAKLIDSSIFVAFKTLTSDSDAERIDGGLSLLHQLDRTHDAEKHAKERDYTLTRLIRGLGASTLASRAGNFTALVGFLSGAQNADITLAECLTVLDKQLHVGATVANKEDSDGLIGHILLVGALLRSGRLAAAADAEITRCTELLVRAAGNKVFHASMAYKFLVDMIAELSGDQFATAVWPAVRGDLRRQWPKQTCNTVHFLLVAADKYPEVVDAAFLQKSVRTPELLTPQAHRHLGRIFWGNTSLAAITHPAYEALSRFLLGVRRANLLAFWSDEVDATLAAPNKIKEVVTVKLLTDFLGEAERPLDSRTALALLTPRVVRMMVASLRSLKQQKHDVLVSFYEEFFDALTTFVGSPALEKDDAGKVAIIKKFVLSPGTLLIEKYLPQKSVHQMITKLGADGIRSLMELYRSVFLAQLTKVEEKKKTDADGATAPAGWQNVERLHAVQMMQYLLGQKCVAADLEWRIEQLRFLFTVGVFHVNEDGSEPVVADKSSVTRELSTTARNLFYASLQMRLPQLKDEKRVLLAVVEHAHGLVAKKNVGKLLRAGATEWSKETAAAWQQMYDVLQSGKNEKKLTLVFQILFLHMGLQLFREPEMARVAIADLVQCMEKTKQAKKVQKRARKSLDATAAAVEEEPEWIEVVVDLFLHLLSQNTSFLRNVVNNVFPQLCGELTLTAVHQVLGMLDMKDGKNPLSAATEEVEENDDDEEEEDDDEEEADENDDDEEENDDDEEEDEDEDDDDDVMEDDEGTVTDQLRNAVSTALVSLMPAASAKTANGAADESDSDSVDLNDMDDDEAARLDAALSAAFQSIRGAASAGGSSNTTKSKKKTKAERTTNTTVMHFRIRVLDLLDIYLRTAPSLSVCMEMLPPLCGMIEYCADSDLKPLADKVDRVLKRLLALRQFGSVQDVTVTNLRDLVSGLVALKTNPVRLAEHNQLLSRSVAFAVAAAGQLPAKEASVDDAETTSLLGLLMEYASEFIGSRNPRVPYGLLQDVFRLRWPGAWRLGQLVADKALGGGGDGAAAVRIFRRTQALELLALMYRNHGAVLADTHAFNGLNAQTERTLAAYVTRFAAAGEAARVSPKEFGALVQLLTEVHRTHQLKAVKAVLDWVKVGEQVQRIRGRVVLVTLKPYKRLCQQLRLEVLRNVAPVGQTADGSDDDEEEQEEKVNKKSKNSKKGKKAQKAVETEMDVDSEEEVVAKQAKKRKASDQAADSKRDKKLKKAERLRAASEGLNGLSFTANDDVDEEDDDGAESD